MTRKDKAKIEAALSNHKALSDYQPIYFFFVSMMATFVILRILSGDQTALAYFLFLGFWVLVLVARKLVFWVWQEIVREFVLGFFLIFKREEK